MGVQKEGTEAYTGCPQLITLDWVTTDFHTHMSDGCGSVLSPLDFSPGLDPTPHLSNWNQSLPLASMTNTSWDSSNISGHALSITLQMLLPPLSIRVEGLQGLGVDLLFPDPVLSVLMASISTHSQMAHKYLSPTHAFCLSSDLPNDISS